MTWSRILWGFNVINAFCVSVGGENEETRHEEWLKMFEFNVQLDFGPYEHPTRSILPALGPFMFRLVRAVSRVAGTLDYVF